ncbi:unnamed protein product [Polarella glacialis]|uniref:Transmembrane protein n=1 Tax=Polarella glacialis TaxID=89957 RepID=A0A813ICG7_POLGL|nr:unnamed protein product [Polarella glacialis]
MSTDSSSAEAKHERGKSSATTSTTTAAATERSHMSIIRAVYKARLVLMFLSRLVLFAFLPSCPFFTFAICFHVFPQALIHTPHERREGNRQRERPTQAQTDDKNDDLGLIETCRITSMF